MFEENREKITCCILLFIVTISVILSMVFHDKRFLVGASLACFITQIAISLDNMN